jgi:2'-5' RNA ligase
MHDDRARLFTAVWPDTTLRERLAAESAAWRWPPAARRVEPAKLHLTLHFIGAFPRSRVDDLAAALAAVAAEPAALAATQRKVWRGGIAALLFAADATIVALHAAVGSVVARFGVALDPRPYAPHVTLARRARGAVPPPRPAELEWHADGFALVESAGGGYRVLHAFGAAAAPSDAPR